MQFRYSNKSGPTDFPWETAIPISPFWDTWTYKDSYPILTAIPAEEFQQYNLDEKYGSAPQQEKIEVVLKILLEKLRYEESKSDLYTTDFKQLLVARRQGPTDLVPLKNLSEFLAQNTDRYAESNALAVQCLDWLDNKVGKSSPQSIGSCKTIAATEWKQGNREEAEKMIAELFERVEGVKTSKFAVYADDEKENAQKWLEDLKSSTE
ncbi:hypothetical protein ASPZODRAFT_76808 [Penicilliopsis zonata CBS 506.65]|uniref:Uncharacterized protein n=1 Tax=Penicilliopsis zonata CBS 506.65 TaxID=1073090 RepID=A0A1L9S5R0_9EURO|nr:hypothetical protein ASPZODRAFT_76808 [Penicilliopsis zonata CBS 506.65]OJJ42506.1 hypothetical protein ASPZODRAFT_76808 [Penicilliopsis zonata CBS 506.65]